MKLDYRFSGGSHFLADAYYGIHPMPVAILCRLQAWPNPLMVMLDTAAHWCLLPPHIAEALGCDMEPDPRLEPLSTRFGLFHGRTERIPLTLEADEGAELHVDATFFVARDWPGPTVIGWKGCLERIRFALHPDPDDLAFCFAPL